MAIDSSVRQIINQHGYITIDDMMSEVLTNNTNSYYKNLKHIGKDGDFITSPEISQLFGEIIGLWVIEQWQKMGSPAKFTLLELGPGQGLLMRDLLKTATLADGFVEAAQVKLFDINPHFIKKQQEVLSTSNFKIDWLENIDNLPKQPIIAVSNEFFDALPIKQYKKIKQTWHELVLIVDPADSQIKFDSIEINKNLQKQLKYEHPFAEDGATVEESVLALDVIRKLSKLIYKHKGSCLTIDYGYNTPQGTRLAIQYNPTLQAIKNHAYHPLIEAIGEADLSAHVDFQNLNKAVTHIGIKNTDISTQEHFLKKYGILIRLKTLQAANPGKIAEALGRQVYRLTAKDQMGELFKVFEFWKY